MWCEGVWLFSHRLHGVGKEVYDVKECLAGAACWVWPTNVPAARRN